MGEEGLGPTPEEYPARETEDGWPERSEEIHISRRGHLPMSSPTEL